MSENEINEKINKIGNSIISYLEFLNNFKTKTEEKIVNSNNENSKYSFIFRSYNLDCYMIEKKILDSFKSSVNFEKLKNIYDKENIDKKEEKLKEELKKFLEKNPYTPTGEKVKFYSKEEEMKEIVKNLGEYSFINKEMLVDGIGVPESKFKENLIKVSKNEENTSLLMKNYTIIINNEKNKEKEKVEENEEFRNLYYVEDITKKIFVLLYYFNNNNFEKKVQKEIKDIYKFKHYYLINKDWLNEYKEFFMYNIIKGKIEKTLKNKNYSYSKIKMELNNIINEEIGQIRLYNETKISNFLRNAKNLIIKSGIIETNKDNNNDIDKSYIQETLEVGINYILKNFEIINEDIYQLLMREEFLYNLDDKIKEQLAYEIIVGNNQIIIKNKLDEENTFSYNYLVYTLNEKNENQEKYMLNYILKYDKETTFFNDFQNNMKERLKQYLAFNMKKNKKNENFENEILDEINIYDAKRNILGSFIIININDKIINYNFENKINDIIKKEKIKDSRIEYNIKEYSIELKKNENNRHSKIEYNFKEYSIELKKNEKIRDSKIEYDFKEYIFELKKNEKNRDSKIEYDFKEYSIELEKKEKIRGSKIEYDFKEYLFELKKNDKIR